VETGRAFAAPEVLRDIPFVDESRVDHRWRARTARTNPGDLLLSIEPSVYVSDLLARRPGRNHKVECPFHDDRRPSLHVFPTPERGWCCSSCGRGGSIYDLAAALWGVTPCGRELIELRRALPERFAGLIQQRGHGLERP
jgi:hypothetical protein